MMLTTWASLRRDSVLSQSATVTLAELLCQFQTLLPSFSCTPHQMGMSSRSFPSEPICLLSIGKHFIQNDCTSFCRALDWCIISFLCTSCSMQPAHAPPTVTALVIFSQTCSLRSLFRCLWITVMYRGYNFVFLAKQLLFFTRFSRTFIRKILLWGINFALNANSNFSWRNSIISIYSERQYNKIVEEMASGVILVMIKS